MTLNPIEHSKHQYIAQNKNTPQTRTSILFLKLFQIFKNPYVSNILSSKLSAFDVDLYGILYILYTLYMLRATQPNSFC